MAPMMMNLRALPMVLMAHLLLLMMASSSSSSSASSHRSRLLLLSAGAEQAAAAGEWELAPAEVASDVCGVGRFQDVSEFVASSLVIANVNSTGFQLDNDNDYGEYYYCTWINATTAFVCSEIELEQRAMRGATLIITTQLSGVISLLLPAVDNNVDGEDELLLSMDTVMNVVIQRCSGFLCGLLKATLDFPCDMKLLSPAVPKEEE